MFFFPGAAFATPCVAAVLALLAASVADGLVFCRGFGLSVTSKMGCLAACFLVIQAGSFSLWRWEALAAGALSAFSLACAETLPRWGRAVELLPLARVLPVRKPLIPPDS